MHLQIILKTAYFKFWINELMGESIFFFEKPKVILTATKSVLQL